MGWKVKKDPRAPAEPAFHHPDRCMNCGHLSDEHDPDVGCMVDGGTKYIENDEGVGRYACSCEQYLPSPEKESRNDA